MSAVLHELNSRLALAPAGALCVGLSGGLDSTVLLHALAASPAARERGLSAIHVDHGLNRDSARWAEQCAAGCAALSVPLRIERVQVEGIDELGLEAAARRARYAAFSEQLPAKALLVLAHHQEDQAETLLLRLLHGAGHEGLAGMRALRPFGDGWLWRPLLDLPRAALHDYAIEHGLRWIEDPANAESRHARNHLRHVALPALAQRWPDAKRRIAAAAKRLREEADVLESLAQQALAQAQGVDPTTLSLGALRAMAPALRRLVVGRWLDALGLPRPPPGLWSRLDSDLLEARVDADPKLAWRCGELRRYRDLLYALRPLPPVDMDWTRNWSGEAALELPDGFGTLALQPATRIEAVEVRPRRGGERIEQPGVRRELRTLLQDLGLPPWMRERLPLVFSPDGELLAAGDLALAPAFAQRLNEAGTRLRWL